ncbi:hypothetical protein F7D34_06940 [Prevotella copri]|uniref:Uncharacterized protein n=1 Tax=Segatella copri TaxID=165179 RepID=A0A646HJI5_9BACT|nr:hypothetical protein [Segatella copri]MQN89351.1 hypothetical protein [Segatella copri]MQO77707.1 hypothetical protein [Segatella copri]
MTEEGCVIFNACLYMALFCFWWNKQKGLNSGTYILLIWSVCSLVGVFYEPVNIYGHMRKITVWPYLYLFVCNCLMFIPILAFKAERLRHISINNRLLIPLGIVLGIISIPPFVESSIYYYINHSNTQMMLDAFNDRYADTSTTYSYLSTFSKRLTYILHSVRTLSLFLLFYMPVIYNKKKSFKFAYIGVCLSVVLIVLESLILLARFQVVIYGLYGFFIYLILRNLYNEKLRTVASRYMKILAIAFVSLQIVQTASRYFNYTENLGQQEVGAIAYLGQYLGESMGNFNGNIVHSDYYFGADPILKTYADFLHIPLEKTVYREGRFHTNQFFTVVGEFWRAYGGVATLVIFLIFPYWLYVVVKRINYKKVSFAFFILLIMYSKMAIVGIFYHAYFVDANELLVMPLFVILLTLYKKKKYVG